MKKRFIFDLDGTLLHGDYISERDYFRSVLNKEDAEKFLLLYFEKLCEYESLHQKYDYSSLSKFLTEKTGINITSEIISCPHTHGDDPYRGFLLDWDSSLVPTRMGMIPTYRLSTSTRLTCPHTHGDDPLRIIVFAYFNSLSPHAWG